MSFYRAALAGAALIISTAALAQSPNNDESNSAPPALRPNSYINLLATMSGKCTTLKIAGRNLACKLVAYAHHDMGRVNFAVAIDDPSDTGRVVSFSGEMVSAPMTIPTICLSISCSLNSKDRPKVDGLTIPLEQASTGHCRQTGNFAAKQVFDIRCSATDVQGRRYELLFVSDGSPVSIRRIRQSKSFIEDPFK